MQVIPKSPYKSPHLNGAAKSIEFESADQASSFLRKNENLIRLGCEQKVALAHLVKFMSIATLPAYNDGQLGLDVSAETVKSYLTSQIGLPDDDQATDIAKALIKITQEHWWNSGLNWCESFNSTSTKAYIPRHAKAFISDAEVDGGLGLDFEKLTLKTHHIITLLRSNVSTPDLTPLLACFSLQGPQVLTMSTTMADRCNAMRELFGSGELMFRAICHDELTNRLEKGQNQLNKQGDDYVYMSISLVPAADSRLGMRFYGADPIGIFVSHRGAAVDSSGTMKMCPHMVGLYSKNAVTKSIHTRSAKINHSEAKSVSDLAQKISDKVDKNSATLQNSEVLWVGLEPERIIGIGIRMIGNRLPSDHTIDMLLERMKKTDFANCGPICDSYPVFFYKEDSPHKLVQLFIDSTTTVSQVKSQLQDALDPSAKSITDYPVLNTTTTTTTTTQLPIQHSAQLHVTSLAGNVATVNHPVSTSQYSKLDKTCFETLTQMMTELKKANINAPAFSIAGLLDKLCHPDLGYIHMGIVRHLIQKMKSEYDGNRNISPLLVEMHSLIDLYNINTNLAANGDRQLCTSASNALKSSDCSYIVRRQLICLTDATKTAPDKPLTAIDVEDIMEFIANQNSDEIPTVLSRFSCRERWLDGFDKSAEELFCRLTKIDQTFQFTGDSPAPEAIKIPMVEERVQKLLKKEFQ